MSLPLEYAMRVARTVYLYVDVEVEKEKGDSEEDVMDKACVAASTAMWDSYGANIPPKRFITWEN